VCVSACVCVLGQMPLITGRRQNISFKGKQGDTALRLLEEPPHLERAWNLSCLPPVPDILNLVLTTLELRGAVLCPK